jgi:signal transduction histidine kinase
MAQAQAPDREHMNRWLGQIAQLTTRMSLLIRELLDFAKLQEDKPLGLYCEQIDLVALCRQSVAHWQQTAPRHTIHLEAHAPAVLGCWDIYRLERVLGNLLSNAAKYSPAGSTITVTVAREEAATGPVAVLAVTDQGIGIPAADLPYIFDWYRRAGNVTQEISGAGIGLASVRQIVRHHHGTIHVASTEGAGSTFTIRLPLAPPEQ